MISTINQTVTEPPEQEPIIQTEKQLKKQIKVKNEEITILNKRIKHIKREFEKIKVMIITIQIVYLKI